MKSPSRPATLLIAAVLAVLQGACGSTPDETSPPSLPAPAGAAEPWFCEMNAAGDDWECVRDAALARHPAPRRLPPPRPPEPSVVESATALAPTDGTPLRQPTPPATNAAPPPVAAPPTVPTGADATRSIPPDASLRDLPRDLYTVQLVAMKDRAELEAFVRDSGIPELSGARVENDGEIYYALLLGIFPDRAAAERAAAARPAALQGYEPWIRPLGSLQDAMQRADQLAGAEQF